MSVRALLFLSTAALFISPNADACRCLQPTVESSWWNNSDSFVVEVTHTRVVGQERQYVADVVVPFNGCTKAGERIALVTPTESATCGGTLSVGDRWLVFGNSSGIVESLRAFDFDSCDLNKPVAQITTDERAYLEGRQVYCADDGTFGCVGQTSQVSCFADPCQVTSCDEDATCYANYCGGCGAEYYDDLGYQVCAS